MTRKLTEKEASGMTVNERLYLSGLSKALDEAVEKGDKQKARDILSQVFLSPENIEAIIQNEFE